MTPQEKTAVIQTRQLTRTRDADGVYRCDAVETLSALLEVPLTQARSYLLCRRRYGQEERYPLPDSPHIVFTAETCRATWQGLIILSARYFGHRRKYEAMLILLDAFTETERADAAQP